MGTLYVVGAPPGDPDDFTMRALRILGQVGFVVAGDLPAARRLLAHHSVTTPLVSLSDPARLSGNDPILAALETGDGALLLIGWAPGPSGASLQLVLAAVERGFPVVPVPGPVLPVTALVLSGLPAGGFVYLGLLPAEPAASRSMLASVASEPRTLVALETPGRVPNALVEVASTLGARPVVVVADLGQGGAEVWRGTADQPFEIPSSGAADGSYVLVIGGAPEQPVRWEEGRLRAEIQSCLQQGLGARQVSGQLADKSGWSRRNVYRLVVEAAQFSPKLKRNKGSMSSSDQVELYPLRFAALPKEKVWGGTRIATLFPGIVPVDRLIGELWVVWDRLVVENGALRGKTLAALTREWPAAILGTRFDTGQPREFPLLVKFIDTRQTLSVQVHPDDRYAQEHEAQPFGKSEVWVVLDAEPGARVIHGVHAPVARAEAEEAIATGQLQHLLEKVGVDAGDVLVNAPGTIHALGEGILLYELQQSSDLTYRLYDWDRNDPSRQLHISRSLDVADLLPLDSHKTRPVVIQEAGATRTVLCACREFAAEQIVARTSVLERPAGVCFHILTVLEGSGAVRYGTNLGWEVALNTGESLLVPACIDEYELRVQGGPLSVIKAYVPDLVHDIVEPLRLRGVTDDAIAQLGGDERHSDLVPHLRR